jgi:uncharacterized protein (DUF2236 family)
VCPCDDAELLRAAGLADLVEREELFRPGGWLRRVSAEPVLLLGGGRALLLEVAHPLVAAGVAEHSDFRRDPFGRLQRTLDAMSAIVFRERAAALAAVRGVRRAHERVRGTLARTVGGFAAGTPYAGGDPELVRWVWATLVDTAWLTYERFVGPLQAGALAEYYADQRVVAQLLGVPASLLPATPEAFRRWLDAELAGDALAVSEEARAIAQAVLDPPAALAGRSTLRDLTSWLLPERLRQAFGLAWDAARRERVERLVASVRELRARGAVDACQAPR